MLRTFFLSAAVGSAWYLPGLAPTDYEEGDSVNVLVNRLTSEEEELGFFNKSSMVGYDYYNEHFHFCKPEGGQKSKGGSLGSILFGDRIYTSPMELKMLKDEECVTMCSAKYSTEDLRFLSTRVFEGFEHHWLIDGLPVTARYPSHEDGTPEHFNGIGLGEPRYYIPPEESAEDKCNFYYKFFNHFEIHVEYHHNKAAQKYRVVGAYVVPSSRNSVSAESKTCGSPDDLSVQFGDCSGLDVSFSYSVKWEPSDVSWATRWDKQLIVYDSNINWFALLNSSILVVILGTACAGTLTKMLRHDIARYNNVGLDSDDIPDEMGWKLVAGDVFRPPQNPQLFALAVGSGFQTLLSILITLTLAALGFLSPANRGSFSTALLLFNTLLGGVGGYVSAVTYKTWGGTMWKVNLLLTPLVLPALVFGLFFCLNFFLAIKEASGAVPIGSMLSLLFIWAGIGVPLSLVFGFFGFKRELLFPPNMRVNQIARQIPPQPLRYRLIPMTLVGGLVPFFAVALQLRYIMKAIWYERLYYMFGFLFVSTWAMVLLSVASTLLSLYFMLVTENYLWQWRTFFVSGSPSLYVFIYSCYYLIFKMSLESSFDKLLFVTYSGLASLLCFLALGSVGSIAAYLFVRKIYESIKVD